MKVADRYSTRTPNIMGSLQALRVTFSTRQWLTGPVHCDKPFLNKLRTAVGAGQKLAKAPALAQTFQPWLLMCSVIASPIPRPAPVINTEGICFSSRRVGLSGDTRSHLKRNIPIGLLLLGGARLV